MDILKLSDWLKEQDPPLTVNYAIGNLVGKDFGKRENFNFMLSKEGYIYVEIEADSPYAEMSMICDEKKGWVSVHRLVMAKTLGRVLQKNDIVHHIDEVKYNNLPDNLMLVTNASHWIEAIYPRETLKYPCKGCNKPILAGSKTVIARHRKKYITTKFAYHYECYQKYAWDNTGRRLAKMEEFFETHQPVLKDSGKRRAIPGRERERNSLVALMIYHKKKGHTERVAELEKKIEAVSIQLPEIAPTVVKKTTDAEAISAFNELHSTTFII